MRSADRVGTAGMFTVTGLAFGSWSGRIPDIKQALHLDASSLGLALLGTTIGSMVGMRLVRWALAHWKTHAVASVATVLVAMGVCPIVAARSAWQLGVALAVFGLTLGAVDVSMNSYAVALESVYGRPIMAGFHAWFSVGGLVGAGAAGLARGAHVTAERSILTSAATLVAVALVTGVLLRDRPVAQPSDAPNGGRRGGTRITRPAVVLGLLALVCLVNEGAVGDWSGVLLTENRHVLGSFAVAGLVAFNVCMLAGRFVGDRVVDSWGARRTMRVGTAVSCCGLVTGLLVPVTAVTVAGFAFLGLGLSVAVPVIFSTAGRMSPEYPGRAISQVSSVGYIGFLVGPPAVGLVAHQLSLPLALGGVGVLLAVVPIVGYRFVDDVQATADTRRAAPPPPTPTPRIASPHHRRVTRATIRPLP